MIANPNDYINYLYNIQDYNRPTHAPIPPSDVNPLYEIDLNTREIMAPPFLSVRKDHNAETIYFVVNRYYDNVDLSELHCVIEYENADPVPEKRGHVFYAPWIDTTSSFVPDGKMVFPWIIQGAATEFTGIVKFAVKFYRIDNLSIDKENGTSKNMKEYDYVLNTKAATSKVLYGLDFQLGEDYIPTVTNVFDAVYAALNTVAKQSDLYWIVFDENGTAHDPNFDRESIIS